MAVFAVAAVLVTAAAASDPGREQIRYNAADQAAARATVLRRSDLTPSTGWTGGRVKPDLSPGPTCPNYHPKQSDLVLTGAAQSSFRRGAVVIGNEIQVMKTRRMVTLDWRREVLAPGTIACQRRDLARSLGSSAKVVSFTRIPFPRIAKYTAEFRALVDVSVPGGKTAHLVIDAVLVGRGRSEISFTTLAPASAKASLTAAERRLARRIVARARA
ncbi:MAG TPA: hypothetical protein VGJ27_11350 [Gaiellaceae bacterium]